MSNEIETWREFAVTRITLLILIAIWWKFCIFILTKIM